MMREWADTRRLLGMIDGSLIARKTSDTPPIHRVTLNQPDGVLARIAVAMSALVRTTDSGWTLRNVR